MVLEGQIRDDFQSEAHMLPLRYAIRDTARYVPMRVVRVDIHV